MTHLTLISKTGSVYSKINLLFLALAAMVLLSSCSACKYAASASADFAKQKEAGNSKYNQNDVVGENIWAFIDCVLDDPLSLFLDQNSNDAEYPYMQPNHIVKKGYITLRSGLEFISKGGKYAGTFDTKIHLNYLEVPITLVYNYPIQKNGTVFGGLGPYFAYGIGGKIKSPGFSQSSFGENNGGYKRFDAGLTLMAGYKLPMGLVGFLSYDWGLANVAYSNLDITAKNRVFAINVGYYLDKIINPPKKK